MKTKQFKNIKVNVEGIELYLSGTYTPGDPGVRYDKDGSGQPPEGAEIEYIKIEYQGIDIMPILDALDVGYNDFMVNLYDQAEAEIAASEADDGDNALQHKRDGE